MSRKSKHRANLGAKGRVATLEPEPEAAKSDFVQGKCDAGARAWIKAWLPSWLIVGVGMLVYGNSLSGEFVLDDRVSIQSNPTIHRLWPITQVLFPSHDLIADGNTVEGRPLLNLSFALNYALGGTEVWGYHAVNLGIHLVAALLLFGVLRRTLSLPVFRERMEHSATWLALVAALVWVVHPLQTESVSYLSQRAESLVGLFYLLTMYLAIRGFGEERAWWWQAGAVAACVLGMATKEVMVTAPLLVWLYDWCFVGGGWKEVWRRRWRFYACMFVLGWGSMAAILLGTSGSNWGNVQALLQQLSGDRAGPAGSGHDIHWLDYARMQCWAMTRYVRLCFWPSPLIFAYGRDMAQGFWGVAPSALWVAMMMGATAWGLWRRHWAGYGGAWFILILAPTSSVVPLSGQMVAEHRMYLPLAAVIMLVVTGGFFAWRHFTRNLGEESRRWACVAGACLMVMLPAVLGAVTMARNEDYKTALSLWQDSVTKWPRSAEAQNAMGFALHQKGRLAESIPCYQKALEIRPDYTLAHTNLGNALRDQGNVAEALSHFQRAVALKPENAETHANLGGALLQSGKLTEALEQYQKALDLNPHSAGEHCNLGSALIEMGRIDDGLFHLYKALEIDDKCLQAHHNLGNMLLRRGQVAEAIQHYRKVLEIMPGYVEGHNNLAMALFQNGQLRDALGQFEKSLQINPQGLSALNNLARMLAIGGDPSLRDGRRALELALRANQISGDKNPFILQTLAAAYAENGRFTEADETAERAESFARAQGNHDELEKIHTIRSLYQAGKPWHLPAVAGGDGASH